MAEKSNLPPPIAPPPLLPLAVPYDLENGGKLTADLPPNLPPTSSQRAFLSSSSPNPHLNQTLPPPLVRPPDGSFPKVSFQFSAESGAIPLAQPVKNRSLTTSLLPLSKIDRSSFPPPSFSNLPPPSLPSRITAARSSQSEGESADESEQHTSPFELNSDITLSAPLSRSGSDDGKVLPPPTGPPPLPPPPLPSKDLGHLLITKDPPPKGGNIRLRKPRPHSQLESSFDLVIRSESDEDRSLLDKDRRIRSITALKAPSSGSLTDLHKEEGGGHKKRPAPFSKRKSFIGKFDLLKDKKLKGKEKENKKSNRTSMPLDSLIVPSVLVEPSSSVDEEALPPVIPRSFYVCVIPFQSDDDCLISGEVGDRFYVLGKASRSPHWVAVQQGGIPDVEDEIELQDEENQGDQGDQGNSLEQKEEADEAKKEEDSNSEIIKKIGFFPLGFLVPEGEEVNCSELEISQKKNLFDPPPELASRFIVVKPVLDNTPFLKHVGLHETVKTLKAHPNTTVSDLEVQLTQSVCRGLKDDVAVLIEEECTICQLCHVNEKGVFPLKRNANVFKIQYLLNEKQKDHIFLFKRRKPDTSTDAKRKNIVAEIHSTEVFYVSALLEMIEGFKKPLLIAARRPNSHIKEEDMIKLFGNAETILRLHVDLFKALNQRLYQWSSTALLGDVFLHFAPIMIIYTEYSTGYTSSVDLLVKYMAIPAFLSEHSAARKKMTLENLLIMPIQRLPRYNLLLRDLLKHTKPNHPDYSSLEKSIEVIQRQCDRVDECTQKAANAQMLVDLAMKDGLVNSYIAAHRQLVVSFEAPATKAQLDKASDIINLIRTTKQVASRMVFHCFSDLLVCGLASDAKERVGMQEVPLNLVWLNQSGDSLDLEIVIPFSQFVVHCENEVEKDHYFASLTDAIEKQLQKQKSHGDGQKRFWEFEDERGTYKGEWEVGLPHGSGIFSSVSSTYKGEFLSGKPEGKGVCQMVNGSKYTGHWSEGLMQGKGEFEDSSGASYNGDFLKDKFQGIGKMVFPNGDTYQGSWVRNLPSGRGTLRMKRNGFDCVYDGEFQEGVFHGIGCMKYSLGEDEVGTYQGDFRFGLRSGRGICQKQNGVSYDGDWVNNFPHGKGILIDDDGARYVGGMECGLKSGGAIILFRDGTAFEGQFVGGFANCKSGKLVFPNGVQYEGGFKMGKMHGAGTLTLPKEKLILEGTWENGLKEGKFHIFHDKNEGEPVIFRGNIPSKGMKYLGVKEIHASFVLDSVPASLPPFF